MNPRITCAPRAAVVILVLIAAALQTAGCDKRGGAGGGKAGGTPKAYFSADDGKTFFADEATRIPPFKTAAGATAHRAYVTRCADDKLFVAYVEKYADEDKRSLENSMKDPRGQQTALAIMLMGNNPPFPLVKKPLTGDKGWVASTPEFHEQYTAIARPTCPDGSPAERVSPE